MTALALCFSLTFGILLLAASLSTSNAWETRLPLQRRQQQQQHTGSRLWSSSTGSGGGGGGGRRSRGETAAASSQQRWIPPLRNPASKVPPTTPAQPQQPQQQPQRVFSLRPLFSSFVAGKSLESDSTTISNKPVSWISVIQNISNWASLFCILDCTVLPLLTILLPLVGWVSAAIGGSTTTAALQHSLCVWSHNLAMYFVLPVGTFTTLWNYQTGHQNKRVAALGLVGIIVIGLANGGGEWIVAQLALVTTIPTHVLTTLTALHHGILHRVANLAGCALLLGSNYMAQQLGCDCGMAFCQPGGRRRPTASAPNPLLQVSSNHQRTASPAPQSSVMTMQTRMIQFKYQQELQQQQRQPLPDDSTDSDDEDIDPIIQLQ